MSLDPELAELLIHTITLEPFSEKTAFGGTTYGTGVDYPARVEKKQKLVKTGDGREILATSTIYVGPAASGSLPTPTPQDRITVPDGSTPPILAFEQQPDEDGPHHVVIYCG